MQVASYNPTASPSGLFGPRADVLVRRSWIGGLRAGARPGWEGGYYAFMRRVLATDHGRALYRERKHSIEPVFGQIKANRRIDRFLRRGRGAVRSEWRLIAASHNLLKLHSHWIAPATR